MLDSENRDLLSNTKVCNGRYVVEDTIGAGGFGITYSAWDTILQMRVAIKEYLPGEFSTRAPGTITVSIYGGEKEEQYKDGLAKFYEESKRLSKFQGVPGIVQILDVFLENETAYIVMEYLDGETLGERLKREEKIPYKEAVKIMLPILQALETVHKENILHRDIAPNNIFLCKNGEVKLLDFGAARSATGTHSKSLTVLYKEGYTAEEQYRSRGDQGTWTDVYACAATLYQMLTGKVPEGAMERRRKDTLKFPSKCGAKLPVNVDRAIMNALNLEIENRTSSAGQFMDELLSSKGVRDRFKKIKNKRRERIPYGIWGFGLVAVICVSVFMFLIYDGRFEFVDGFANLFVEEGKVRVPNIVNMEEDGAKERLAKLNLLLDVVDYEFNSQIEEGTIITQTEERGSLVDSGSVIHVTASEGYGRVIVPDFMGLTEAAAIELAQKSDINIKISHVCIWDDSVPSDVVIYQGWKVGEFVPNDNVVNVDIGLSSDEYKQEFVNILNERRRANGLSDLSVSDTLNEHLRIFREGTIIPPELGKTSSSWGITISVPQTVSAVLSTNPEIGVAAIEPQYNYIGINTNEHDDYLWISFSEGN